MRLIKEHDFQVIPPLVWHNTEWPAVMEHLSTTQQGLSTPQAKERLSLYGPNIIQRVSAEGPLALLWHQINSPLIWTLIVSALIAIALGKAADAAVVLAVVAANTLLGFLQEYRAGKAIEAVSRMVPENVTVMRSGAKLTIPTSELVPGDVVFLASGDKVPADLRLFSVKNLRVEEAALTGESVPVSKRIASVEQRASLGDHSCMAYGGTLVSQGTGSGIVATTGAQTELGRISTMLRDTTKLDTPLTRTLADLSKYITIGVVIITIILLVVGITRSVAGGVTLVVATRDTLMFAIAMAVGAIPEGLPAIITISLAIGVRRMAARRAIVRKLPAVETLGSTTVICSDKTGTLTKNEMTVQEIWTPACSCQVSGVGYQPQGDFSSGGQKLDQLPAEITELLRQAALCSDASLEQGETGWLATGDPTEIALLVAAQKAGISAAELGLTFKRLDTIPFESQNQFMAALHQQVDHAPQVFAKGAPEVILHMCRSGAKEVDSTEVLKHVDFFARQGMRVLAVAAKQLPPGASELSESEAASGFSFSGLMGMIDPPRQEALELIEAARRAGITVKMITGDHVGTAQAIGQKLGLAGGGTAVSGRELSELDAEGFRQVAARSNVFARVAPEHKLKLVQALQQQGHVVAMTGDGVNDAPALKQSDIGVAMGITGTSASKEAADIVLTDDNFGTIVAAIEEGRRVYDNLIKSLAFVLPTNLGLALIMVVAIIFLPFDPFTGQLLLPLQPAQLLWINLVATVSLALPLAFEAREPDVMLRPPRKPNQAVLSPFLIQRTLVAAVLMTAGAVSLFSWEYFRDLQAGLTDQQALAEAQTEAVTTVIMFQIYYLLNCRSLKASLLKIGLFSNPTIYVGIAAILLLQAGFIYLPWFQAAFNTAPLGARELIYAAVVGAVILPVIGAEKLIRRRIDGR